MKNLGRLLSLVLILPMVASSAEQKRHTFMVGSAAKGAESARVQVVPDLDRRLAKFSQFSAIQLCGTFCAGGATGAETGGCRKPSRRNLLAADGPRRLTLYQSLAGSTNPKDVKLRHYL